MSQKQTKLKVIYTVLDFSEARALNARDDSEGYGRSLEKSHVAWNEYMDAFTFNLRQF